MSRGKGAEPAGRRGTAGCCGNPSPRERSHVPYSPFCETVDTGLLCSRCPTALPAPALWQGNKTDEAAWNGPMLTTCHELRFPKSRPWLWRAVIEPQAGGPASMSPAGGLWTRVRGERAHAHAALPAWLTLVPIKRSKLNFQAQGIVGSGSVGQDNLADSPGASGHAQVS